MYRVTRNILRSTLVGYLHSACFAINQHEY